MDSTKVIEIFIYTIPVVIIGVTVYQLVKEYFENEDRRRNYLMHKELNKVSLPMRLQAYERMTLFLERIHPNKLIIRTEPLSDDKHLYENYLIASIENEFEHNLTQQIYVSEQCWQVIKTAKNAIIQNIRRINMNEKIDNAQKLREAILNEMMETNSPSSIALSYVNNEVKSLLE